MFYERSLHWGIRSGLLLVVAGILLTGYQPAFAASGCEDASSVNLNGLHHIYRNSLEDDDFFRLDVPEAGILTVEVSDPSAGSVRPRLAWIGGDCSSTEPGAGLYPQTRPAWYLMQVNTPGTYFFRVSSDARQDFWRGFYRLQVGFAPAQPATSSASKEVEESEADPISLVALADDLCRAAAPPEKEVEESEADPISLVAPVIRLCRADTFTKEVEESEADPISLIGRSPVRCGSTNVFAKEVEESEADPISLIGRSPDCCRSTGGFAKEVEGSEADPISLVERRCSTDDAFELLSLCGIEEGDAEADRLVCAREIELGTSLSAELRVEDIDTFSFVLTERDTVVLETRGETDTYGALLDELGRRLSADDDSGSGTNFRIAATLNPGRYFLRVEAVEASEGAYVLETRPTGLDLE